MSKRKPKYRYRTINANLTWHDLKMLCIAATAMINIAMACIWLWNAINQLTIRVIMHWLSC